MTRGAAFVAEVMLLLAWNIAIAGRIAQGRIATAPFRIVSGLCGFLVAPALLISVAGSSALTGRAIGGLGWLWPLVAWLCTAQVAYVIRRGLAAPLVAGPMLAFNFFIAFAATVRYAAALGFDIPVAALAPGLGLANIESLLLGTSNVTSPLLVAVPVLAPAGAVASRVGNSVRSTIAILAAGTVLMLVATAPETFASLDSWALLGSERATQVIVPRSPGSLLIGLRILPELTRIPPSAALHDDLALADSLGVRALLVRVAPEACTAATLDSLDRSLEALRHDSLVLIVVLGYPRDAAEAGASESAYLRHRIEDVKRIVRHLGPDYLVTADEPSGAGLAAMGVRSAEWWQRYVIATAMAAHASRPATRVMLTLDGDGVLDSTLYEWATADGSPVSATALSIAPSAGAARVVSALELMDRRLHRSVAAREQWLLATGSPVLEGEGAQQRLARHVLLWAAARPQIRGVVLADAADYDRMTGFRSASGRLRRVAADVAATIRALAEPLTPLP